MKNPDTNRIQSPPDATGEEYTRGADPSLPATDYGDPAAEYAALTGTAALVDRSNKTVFRLSGRDPAGMLAAILTNEVPKEPERGVYAALLNPKGRIQTDLRVLKIGGDILVDTEPEGADAAAEILGRYAPFSRVKLENLSKLEGPLGYPRALRTRGKKRSSKGRNSPSTRLLKLRVAGSDAPGRRRRPSQYPATTCFGPVRGALREPSASTSRNTARYRRASTPLRPPG